MAGPEDECQVPGPGCQEQWPAGSLIESVPLRAACITALQVIMEVRQKAE